MLNAKRRENDFIYAYSGRSIMSTFKKYPLVRRGAVSALAGYPVSGYRHKKKMPKSETHGLTGSQVEAFHEVFNLFDINGGGTIDADELNSALESVDIQLTHQEIHDVLLVIDEDGNGEIDFDEFLALMTSTEKYLETVRTIISNDNTEKKENILFSALAKFMRKSALSSLSEIERYYSNKVRKSPHVVGHYAAGARLIGLTEKQMAKHWATLNVTGDRNADSPYAQPVCLFIPGAFPKLLHGRSHNGKIKLTVTNRIPADEKTKNGSGDSDDAVISSQSTESSGKLPIITRNKNLKYPLKKQAYRCSSSRLKIQVNKVPLPAVKVAKKNQQLTIEHLPMIRSEVSNAQETYRRKRELAREDAMSKQCANFTALSGIPSRTMQLHFKGILEAYNFQPTQVPTDLITRPQPWELNVVF